MPARRAHRPPFKKLDTAVSNTTTSALVYLGQLAFVVAGLYACFFSWSVVHEKIAAHRYIVDGEEKRFSSFFVNALCMALGGITVSSACMVGLKVIGRPVQLVSVPKPRLLVGVGCTMAIVTPLSLLSAKGLSYPVYLTLVMCKMVPSVVVGKLWYGAKYSALKYAAVIVITSGVVAFSLLSASAKASQSNTTEASSIELIGGITVDPATVGAVLAAVFGMALDGFTVSTQDEINARSPGLSSLQMMLMCAASQGVWSCVALALGEALPTALHNPLLKPEFFAALHFFHHAPQALVDCVLLGVLNACGLVFLFYGVRLFGGITVVALMTTRKVGSVFISIAVNGHRIAPAQWAALSAVIVGVVLDTVAGIRAKRSSTHSKPRAPSTNATPVQAAKTAAAAAPPIHAVTNVPEAPALRHRLATGAGKVV